MNPVAFKSDWKTELKNAKLSMKYCSRKVRIITYLGLFLLIPIYLVFLFYVIVIEKNLLYAIYVVWFCIYVPSMFILQYRPKTYLVDFRGIHINKNLHKWKNFKYYIMDKKWVYLVDYAGRIISLPLEAEKYVSNFLEHDRGFED